MLDKNTKILACAVLSEELEAFLPEGIDCEILDFGLHRSPDKLKARLQELIDEASGYENIVLLFGLCGMATLGLHSDTSNIIIPRADDCIAILLGSRDNYLKEQHENMGSLFLSKGWIDGKLDDTSPYSEVYEALIEKYGVERAKRMYAVYEQKQPLKHYNRLAFISTPLSEGNEEYRTITKERADKLGLRYEEIKGSMAFLEKIGNADWDKEFIIVPPGHVITVDDFWPEADKEQPPSAAWS